MKSSWGSKFLWFLGGVWVNVFVMTPAQWVKNLVLFTNKTSQTLSHHNNFCCFFFYINLGKTLLELRIQFIFFKCYAEFISELAIALDGLQNFQYNKQKVYIYEKKKSDNYKIIVNLRV